MKMKKTISRPITLNKISKQTLSEVCNSSPKSDWELKHYQTVWSKEVEFTLKGSALVRLKTSSHPYTAASVKRF